MSSKNELSCYLNEKIMSTIEAISSVSFIDNSSIPSIIPSIFRNNAATTTDNNCTLSLQYKLIEHIVYLYIMSPLCIIGLLLNIINLWIFSDRSFKNLTYKYLRLVAFVDCITCILVFIYCVTNYTKPSSLKDKYFRTWYLVHVYFPLANITAGCNVLLTITVTIERLVSVRWPMEKQRLFSANRVFITLVIVFLFPIVANSVNFLVYRVSKCNNAEPTQIASTLAYKYFGICKEILLRFIPICILICANCLLLMTVRKARQKFKQPTKKIKIVYEQRPLTAITPLSASYSQIDTAVDGNGSGSCYTTPVNKYLSNSQSQTDALLVDHQEHFHPRESTMSTTSSVGTGGINRESKIISTPHHSRKQHQERQLTIMLIWLSTLYLCGQIPMLFAYPNFVFRNVSGSAYKYYALVVNLMELSTYLANFFIYITFTTQFRLVFLSKIKNRFMC
ncbi:unnamed protein product [Didymodactylos carnosus]|uniref:G-protein coupled receptors family 1 profile domain-containing protein n=1 Tax=Didymodactylos carnosus TaxID=1234261 RepID=A0A814B6T7_9BILA|nr:unnamed protein product [Didymodactylos carnosus]CAF0924384.1 unnamed protein product [Didymodactylos carnosus]CAF3532791.1 unnamed protein product [Didymodactylos carnosus]CAF3703297.1 unnamed protein product [Didymodactylos carnosus]